MVSLPALGREMGQATSPAARLVTDSIPPRTAEWWRLRRSNRNSGKHSATLSVWSPNFATMRKIPRRRKLVLPQSLRLRQQTSGVRVSPAKIRSEERRVGKECRSRRWAYHEEQKNDMR